MTAWTSDELARIGAAQELQLASARPDGTLRPFTTMWVVRAGDELYVRSAYGPNNPWYRRARASGVGRIRAGGVERDVTFAAAAADAHTAIDAAYHAKYDRYGPRIVGSVVGPHAEAVTVRLLPRIQAGSPRRAGEKEGVHLPLCRPRSEAGTRGLKEVLQASSLVRRHVVGAAGFEPAASSVSGRTRSPLCTPSKFAARSSP